MQDLASDRNVHSILHSTSYWHILGTLVKITLFLICVGIIYLFAICLCTQAQRDKLLEDDNLVTEQIEFEEYTVNGSDSEGEGEEESKVIDEMQGVRRMRIRRRGTLFFTNFRKIEGHWIFDNYPFSLEYTL